MNNLPLVSISVITYNHEEFIGECLDSIIAQDYPNLEIIVADDCSTDKTQDILKAYQTKYKNIELILQDKNVGITNNSNSGLFAAIKTGAKYIHIFGGDDIMLPGKISKQVKILEEYPEMAFCHHVLDVFDNDSGRTIGTIPFRFDRITLKSILRKIREIARCEKSIYNPQISSKKLKINTQKDGVRIGNIYASPSMLMRASAIPTNGYDVRVPIVSDWLMNIEIMSNGDAIFLDEVLVKYRRHGKNITNIVENKDDYRFEIDRMQVLNIVMFKYPMLSRYVKRNYSAIFRESRLKDDKRFLEFCLLAISYNLFNTRAWTSFLIFILSFGKIKK